MVSVINTVLKNITKTPICCHQVRFYSRWNHRRHVKVYTSEEHEEIEQKKPKTQVPPLFDKYGGLKTTWHKASTEENPLDYKIKPQKVHKPLIATNQKSKVTTTDMLEAVIDKDGNLIYTKMKNNDQRVGTILTDLKSKKEQDKGDLILLEGKRLVKDALQLGCRLRYIIFSRISDVEELKPFLQKAGARLYKMPYREMQMWSDLTTTPGIMGIFKTPNSEDFTPKNPIPLTIICDNIREPGNLGSILRISAAVGCSKVILTKGCVNVWDSKVLRSSAGAHFTLRINKSVEWDEIETLVGDDPTVFIADNKIVSGENTDELVHALQEIPLLPYYGVNFKNPQNIVLVVGGETMGVSKESYDFALRTQGVRLNIPMSNDVESLNVGAALGVIAFEIKKQLVQSLVK